MYSVDQLMQDGVDQGIFPGAVLQVVVEGDTVFKRAYGQADLFQGRPMALDTFFDLASLTKPLATVPAVMMLIQQGRLALDQSCGDICSDFIGSDKADITVRQLLEHRSGLPAWRPFFMRLRSFQARRRLAVLRQWLLDEPLISKPGFKEEYSDLGYMVLQWIVETVSGQRLDQFVSQAVYSPLGVKDLFFNDSSQKVPVYGQYAATQLCPWRNGLMVGQVDDDNAFITGGIAGHAGLFGTADAVCRLLQALLTADQGGGEQNVLAPDIVQTFFRAPSGRRWALGFDTPSKQGSSSGKFFSPDSVGHLGFTGTSFWMHRGKGVVVVLLTNRVHPFRFNVGIKAFRPRLHDEVMGAV